MDGRGWKRPEVVFAAMAGGRLALGLDVLEGALEWITLILGVLIGVLTVVRLLGDLRDKRENRQRRRRLEARRAAAGKDIN